MVSLDESFFFFDSVVRKVWIEENSRPIVTVTGSHRHFSMFGAMSSDGKQLFRQYDRFNEHIFYKFLKQIHCKFPKCYLFLDRAPQHYKSNKVRQYFEQHKDDVVPVWLPTASPE
ncbi:MAG: transposase, partial [Nitrososphaeraceae archaeon]